MGGPGAGARSAARDYWRGQRLHSRKLGRRSDRRRANVKRVHGLSKKLKRAVLGSALHIVEWGGARKRPQLTGQGEKKYTDAGRTGL